MPKTAIILGATGLTGTALLKDLLEDPDFDKIILFSRSAHSITHPKIKEHLLDLFELEKYKELFQADLVFCCIGTTKSKTPDKETYRKIDFGIPATAAKLSEENNIGTFIVISAMGANANSAIFYNKVKGEMEEAVQKRNIKNTYILRPSLITGNREEDRAGEGMAAKVMKVLKPVMKGPLEKYQSITAETIARAMHKLSKNQYSKRIIPSNEIKEIANA
ncbi:NAD(P)H-binding protein [Salegentibacter sp. HM20]